MSIYNRVLFRQTGGPAEPTVMDAPMSPPMSPPMAMPMEPSMPASAPVEGQLAEAQQMAEMQGEEMGKNYISGIMGALDNLDDPKEVIDTIRGNEKPLEERYVELAEFVGEEDALETPPSVLALVQPTIMIEKGAVDSGIGELMQNLTSDVDMETAEGDPTDMAGGVASLMEVGQPPVQNFNQGGLVQKFSNGGMMGLKPNETIFGLKPTETIFDSEILNNIILNTNQRQNNASPRTNTSPLTFADAITQGEEIAKTFSPSDKDYFKKMALLNLANLGVTTGLNLAAGKTPSGQPLTKGNVISRLSQVGAELSPEFTKSAMTLAQAKQAQEQKQKELAFKLGSDIYAKATEEKIVPAGATVIGPYGKVIFTAPEKTKASKFKTFQYVNPSNELIIKTIDVDNNPEALSEIKKFNPEETGNTTYFVAKFPSGKQENFSANTNLGFKYRVDQFKKEDSNVIIKKLGTDTKDTTLKSKQLNRNELAFLTSEENIKKYLAALSKGVSPATGFPKEYTDILYSHVERNKENIRGDNVFARFLPSYMQGIFQKAHKEGIKNIDNILLSENLYVKRDKKAVSETPEPSESEVTEEKTGTEVEPKSESESDSVAASGLIVPELKDFANKIFELKNEITTELLGGKASDIPFPKVKVAKNILQGLNTLTRNFFRQGGERLLKDEFLKFEEQLPKAFGGTLENQTAQLARTKKTLETIKSTLKKELTVKGITIQRQSDVTQLLLSIEPIISSYDELVKAHENALRLRKQGDDEKKRIPIESFKKN